MRFLDTVSTLIVGSLLIIVLLYSRCHAPLFYPCSLPLPSLAGPASSSNKMLVKTLYSLVRTAPRSTIVDHLEVAEKEAQEAGLPLYILNSTTTTATVIPLYHRRRCRAAATIINRSVPSPSPSSFSNSSSQDGLPCKHVA